MIVIRDPKDFASGLLFLLAGLGAVLVARDYPMGSALRMGPGYFPTLLGAALALVGLVLVGRACWRPGSPVGRVSLRPLLLATASILVFAALIRPAGLAVATAALVIVSRFGAPARRPLETLTLALLLAGLAVGLFVYALRLPFDAWPWR